MSNVINIFGEIGRGPGQPNAMTIHAALDSANRQHMLTARIHSEGGSLLEGLAMHDAFAAYPGPKRATVESMAFSAATLVLCAFDDVEISGNGWLMVHGPSWEADASIGRAEEIWGSRIKIDMAEIYAQRCGKSVREIMAWMDESRYFNAEEAVATGFCSRVIDATHVAPSMVARGPAKMRSVGSIWKECVAYEITRLKACSRPPANITAEAVIQVDREFPGLRQRMLNETRTR